MAEGDNKNKALNASDERFKYIGFEVFPGKAGNIFKSDEERKTLIQKVMASFRRSEGEVRERCTLMEERVTGLEKGFLSVVSVLLLVALFLPWFSGNFEIVTERLVPTGSASAAAEQPASEKAAGAVDSTAVTAAVKPAPAAAKPAAKKLTAAEIAKATADSLRADSIAVAATLAPDYVPPGMMKIREVKSDFHSITGIGALFSLGTYGSYIFGSGFILMLSGILMIVFFLSCLVFAGFNLYLLFGVKMKDKDKYALYLKKMLRYNWYPVLLWLAIILLSFIGANYGFDSSKMVVQVGKSYGFAAFLGLTSMGIYLALGAFLILALKGKEI